MFVQGKLMGINIYVQGILYYSILPIALGLSKVSFNYYVSTEFFVELLFAMITGVIFVYLLIMLSRNRQAKFSSRGQANKTN